METSNFCQAYQANDQTFVVVVDAYCLVVWLSMPSSQLMRLIEVSGFPMDASPIERCLAFCRLEVSLFRRACDVDSVVDVVNVVVVVAVEVELIDRQT